jgi:AcrR family transcriptional regulator
MLRQGVRGTSMEQIAREAGIAKPTLYAQFADKDAVLAGIVEELLIEIEDVFATGLAGSGSVADRVGAALAGKYAIIARLLDGSPYAEELMTEHYRVAERFRSFDEMVEGRIAAELDQAGIAEAEALARLIIAASFGIGRQLAGERQIAEAVRLVCRRLIEPEMR